MTTEYGLRFDNELRVHPFTSLTAAEKAHHVYSAKPWSRGSEVVQRDVSEWVPVQATEKTP